MERNDQLSFYTIPFAWGRAVWCITFAFFALWVGVSGGLLFAIFTGENVMALTLSCILFNVVMLAVMLVCEGYAPQRLEIGADSIVVLRRYDSINIYRSQLKSIERLPDDALRYALRAGGVGGLFGYFGRFYTRKLGYFSLYATRLDNLFLLTRYDGGRIVLSCDEPHLMEHFLQ